MFGRPVQFWLCTAPTDMRCQFDGLAARVKQQMRSDPLSGQGFIFVNRRRTMIKVLYFESGGYCLWSKRLEQGLFAQLGAANQDKMALSQTELMSLLEGLDIQVKKRRKRWQKASITSAIQV